MVYKLQSQWTRMIKVTRKGQIRKQSNIVSTTSGHLVSYDRALEVIDRAIAQFVGDGLRVTASGRNYGVTSFFHAARMKEAPRVVTPMIRQLPQQRIPQPTNPGDF